jgi:hypothetical protein
MFETRAKRDGYDGKRATGGRLYVYWWFEAWGSGSRGVDNARPSGTPADARRTSNR